MFWQMARQTQKTATTKAKQYSFKNSIFCELRFIFARLIVDKTGVINDPLGQTHSHASSEHCFLLFCFARFEK